MRARWLIGAGLMVLSGPLAAQSTQPARPPSLVLKVNVLQPLVRGYHLEVEQGWRRHPRYSLGLTAQGYYGTVTALAVQRPLTTDEQVLGYGAELLLRHYLPGRRPEQLTGFYLAAGPHWQRFNMTFQELGWVEEMQPDGLPLLVNSPMPYTETITRYGGALMAGYQGPLDLGPLVLDFYAGLGWRTAAYRSALPDSHYRNSRLDYGAGGLYFPIGFKLGIRL